MSNKVAASMTASIIIDKKEVISSALAAYASAQKEIEGNKIELLVDVSDDEALKRLKEIQKELSGKDYIIKFKNQGIDETLKSLDELYEKIKTVVSGKNLGNGKGIGNSIVDEKTIENVLGLFTKVEGHLGELRKTISDVGDGDEFSPLLKMIKEVGKSISELSESMSKMKLNLNIDLGATNEEKLSAKVAQANHRQLEAYRKLFSSMKASGKTNMQMLKFFEPDDASVSELIGIYRDLIQKIEKEVYGKRNLKAKNIFKEEYKEIENARAAFNRANKSQEKTSPLGELFGGTDLTDVIKQLELIAEDLKNISSVATEFKNSFQNGFNATASVEEIEKLTNKVKELESELNKLKTSSETSVETNISSPIEEDKNILNPLEKRLNELFEDSKNVQKILNAINQDGFFYFNWAEDGIDTEIGKTPNKIRELINILKEYGYEVKNLKEDSEAWSTSGSIISLANENKELKNISQSADEAAVAKNEFVKANKKVKDSADTSADSIEKETSALDEKEWDKNVKVIQEYMDANTELNNLKARDKGTGRNAKEIEYQTKKVEELEKAAFEARATLSSMINPHEAPIDDWNKWLDAMKQFDQAAVGSAKSVAKLEDALRNMATSQINKVDSTIFNSDRYLEMLKPSIGNRSADFERVITEYTEAVNALKRFRDTLDATTPMTKEQSDKFEELEYNVKKTRIEIDKIPKSLRGSDIDSRMKEIDKLTKYLEENTRISKKAERQLRDYLKLLESDNPNISVKKIHTEWTKVAVEERKAGREGKAFFDLLRDKTIGNRAAQLVSYYLSLTDIIRYVSEGIRSIRELDTAMTEMRKVSDETVNSLKEYQNVSFDLANDVGTTAQQIQNSTADWMRLGRS